MPIEFYGYDQCRCSPGFVGVPRNCKPCPPHFICDATNGQQLTWPKGFYPVFSNGLGNFSEALRSCAIWGC